MSEQGPIAGIVSVGEAVGLLSVDDRLSPITVIGTEAIRRTFDSLCIQQALNARRAPGVSGVVLNPDAHCGFGAPVGSVLVSPSHIYPGPVGVDIKCSMSLLQLDLPAEAIEERPTRRAVIDAILERTPTGAGKGQRSVRKSRRVGEELGRRAVIEGASEAVLRELGIPIEWARRCEDASHTGHDGRADSLAERLDRLLAAGKFPSFAEKVGQLGSYGGGNHFGECEIVEIAETARARAAAAVFGLEQGRVAFLSHCGSRGFGHVLADGQFRSLFRHFRERGFHLPGGDRHMVYAPLGSREANDYLDDMALGANFATLNHLLINALVLEAFREVLPGVQGRLVYFISHNIARREVVDGQEQWVHRKGATRALPARHEALRGTPFFDTGHPILLPGNPQAGSAVMAAEPGATLSCFSVNHGAGRVMGRREASRRLSQSAVDQSFAERDILTNCRKYPIDEAPAAYKDFDEVLHSVKAAGLASEVARLRARFVIKDADKADD